MSDQEHLERRQLFLRSYLFSREQPEGDKRAGRRLAGLRRLLCTKLRAARRLRRVLWLGLRQACCCFEGRRRRFPPRPRRAAPLAVATLSSRPAGGARSVPAKKRLSDFISL